MTQLTSHNDSIPKHIAMWLASFGPLWHIGSGIIIPLVYGEMQGEFLHSYMWSILFFIKLTIWGSIFKKNGGVMPKKKHRHGVVFGAGTLRKKMRLTFSFHRWHLDTSSYKCWSISFWCLKSVEGHRHLGLKDRRKKRVNVLMTSSFFNICR